MTTKAKEQDCPQIPNRVQILCIDETTRCANTGREQMQQHAVQKTTYSITSSARTSSVGETSMPSVLAVLRLITSLNLTGA